MLASPMKGTDEAAGVEPREDEITPPEGTDTRYDSKDETGSTGGSDYSDSPILAGTALPSIGSALHASGKCSRCCFYLKNRCRNGINCQFCHLPHERRSRGRGCRGHGTSKLAEDVKEAVPGLMRPPPGLVLGAPPGLDSPKGLGQMTLAAYSQPPTPQAGPMAPTRMAMSLPSTPNGIARPRCLTRTAPPLPPSAPPSRVPEDDDKAPPPPENSPGGAPMQPPTVMAPGALLSAAAQVAEAGVRLSAASMNHGSVLSTAPPQGQSSRGPLLSTPPPSSQVEKRPGGEMPGPPGTFFSKSRGEASRPASLPNTPLLGTVPTSNGSLPRLLGNRGPPGLTHPSKVADAPDARID